ncbi:MAG: hypothetical protein CVV51_12510, partial [Spirochaetae bacterium HGW-Spirochaetae-7]
MLVEDDSITALLEREILERRGYNVSVATSGEEAIRISGESSSIDLVIMDIDLGAGMDGIDAASAMLARKHVPILFNSSRTEDIVLRRVERLDAYGYVIKDAGEKLFSRGTASAAQGAANTAEDRAKSDAEAAVAIATYVRSLKLAPDDFAVAYDGVTETVIVTGTGSDQATRERILLAAGNVQGVTSVDDRMTVIRTEPEARFHTVVRGDT